MSPAPRASCAPPRGGWLAWTRPPRRGGARCRRTRPRQGAGAPWRRPPARGGRCRWESALMSAGRRAGPLGRGAPVPRRRCSQPHRPSRKAGCPGGAARASTQPARPPAPQRALPHPRRQRVARRGVPRSHAPSNWPPPSVRSAFSSAPPTGSKRQPYLCSTTNKLLATDGLHPSGKWKLQIVQDIYRALVEEQLSCRQIPKRLNASKTLTPTGKKQNPQSLRQNTFPSEQLPQLFLLLVGGSFRLKLCRCC